VRFIAERFFVSLVIVWAVITISFFMIRLMPGNAIQFLYHQLLLERTMSPQQALQQVQALYDVNMKAPVGVQYVDYLGGVLHGNLGTSIVFTGTPVSQILANAIPWTVLSVAVAILISFVLGVGLGTVMAYFRRSRLAAGLTLVMTFLNAVPNYVVALVLLYLLADIHHIFPIGGAYTAGLTPGWNGPFLVSVGEHLVLPVAAYVLTAVGGWALGMKSSVVSTLGEEYITAARARGLGSRRILTSYVARNAILPLVTSLGLSMGFMFGGSVFIETLFNYPGIGYYLIQAVDGRDYTLMMGAFILITVAVVAANWVTDIVIQRLDPRSTATRRAA
jgi:peptide/nickel transport system permease protein